MCGSRRRRARWPTSRPSSEIRRKTAGLSARFLEDLLTGAYKVHRKGVRIEHAVIDDPLDLDLAQIPHDVRLIDCRFKKKVSCRDAVFEKNLYINDSSFDQGADFNSVKVKLSLSCHGAVFNGPVVFIGANIGRQFNADGAKLESKDQLANFNHLKVDGSGYFEGAVFSGPVGFSAADIGGDSIAAIARFESKDQGAICDSMKVGRLATFQALSLAGQRTLAVSR
jgi:hypothetical protein